MSRSEYTGPIRIELVSRDDLKHYPTYRKVPSDGRGPPAMLPIFLLISSDPVQGAFFHISLVQYKFLNRIGGNHPYRPIGIYVYSGWMIESAWLRNPITSEGTSI